VIICSERTRLLQLGSGEDEEASQIVLVHVFDRVENIAVK
jgi:hypothetical protein